MSRSWYRYRVSVGAPKSDAETATLTASRDPARTESRRSSRLCIVAPAALRGSIELRASQTLGRESSEHVLQLDHATVSRRHVSLAAATPGLFALTDLGSRNGTWVNGVAVGSLPRAIEHGDVLRMGEVISVFESGPAPDLGGEDALADQLPGQSLASIHLRAEVSRAALAGGATLIEGESGTGKEFVASALHRLSGSTGPYVVANCAALSSSLIDSQLFGHERGAFTGAVSSHDGYFRSANGGTLFLDEIGELPRALQPKLLRAVELGEVVPLGGTSVHRVQLRIIAATNRSLRNEVEGGQFRRDLYARMSLQRIDVPPLRARKADFLLWYELLQRRWHEEHCAESFQPTEFSAEAVEELLLQPWLENLRGLDQLVHGIGGLFLARGSTKVTVADIAPWLPAAMPAQGHKPGEAVPATDSKPPKPNRADFVAVLDRENWNVRGVARHYDRDRRQIYRWIEQFGLSRPDDD